VANSATDPLYVSFKASGRGAWAGVSLFAIPDETDEVISETLSATLVRGQGNNNTLTIIIDLTYASGKVDTITETFNIAGSSSNTDYTVGPYRVHVETSGNTKIDQLYFVSEVMMMSFEDEIEIVEEELIAESFEELADEGADDGGYEDGGFEDADEAIE
jgi:hypothetical protein